MASIKIFGFDNYKIAEYNNISNNSVDEISHHYRDDNSVYSIEKTYD